METTQMLSKCSCCAGLCIALGKRFFDSGIDDIDGKLLPLLKGKANANVHPRVLPSYGMLLWFTLLMIVPWVILEPRFVQVLHFTD